MKINEIFYSVQGEGYHSGTAATFIRFSGCNLRCPFCDTKHEDGEFMTELQVIDKVSQNPAKMVVVTGGEPSLHLTPTLVDSLHKIGKYVAVETNGTHLLPENVDFITLSPKFEFCFNAKVVAQKYNELKVVYNGANDMALYDNIRADYYFIQPCDTGNEQQNKKIIYSCVEFVKNNPKWRISLQTQKILNVL